MYLYQSNHLELLFSQLATILAEPLNNDPFATEIIVVQNQGMAKWVNQQIALSHGIAANLDFPLPARFIWDIFQCQLGALPEQSSFERSIFLWRLFTLLPDVVDRPQFKALRGYLEDDADKIKRYQLALTLSDLYDQYLVYRPDMLAQWEQGLDEHWQAILWRQLIAETDDVHRGTLFQQFRESTDQPQTTNTLLPERICLFGINSLAPAYLEVVARVSRQTTVHMFHLSPCRHYWGDLVSAQQLAKIRKKWQPAHAEKISPYYEPGNPLLASLGTAGQEFFRQLIEYDPEDKALYADNNDAFLLGHLQNDILHLKDRTTRENELLPLNTEDHSVQFHCCHSPLREVQVLHDRLLDMFSQLPDLRPADILVMAPDIEQYTPAIRGIFGAADSSKRIPWSISDQSTMQERPLARTFLDLLGLLDSRFTAPEIMNLLEAPTVQERFGLDQVTLPRLRQWIKESGIRWGLDDEQRHHLNLPGDENHSWQFGLDRLLLGYLMGREQVILQQIVTYPDLGEDDIEPLGSLTAVTAALKDWYSRTRVPLPLKVWGQNLHCLLDDFFAPDFDVEGLRILREAIIDLEEQATLAGCSEEVDLGLVTQYFENRLSQPAGGQAFLTGRATFCNMVPMRSIPFRVICLLGMNDLAFPRSQRPAAFDLIAATPLLGDRCRRSDDRYLFLEALLSTRDLLYISWVGRDLHDNTLLPPSVVVSELMDYIDRGFKTTTQPSSVTLLTEHPLQPFSSKCFDGTPIKASYAEEWLPVNTTNAPSPFLATPLHQEDTKQPDIDIVHLVRFWRHPVRYFLQQQLGVQLYEKDNTLEDAEPFTLDGLEKFHLGQFTANQFIQGDSTARVFELCNGIGLLPQGGFGLNQYQTISTQSLQIIETLQPLMTQPLEPLAIDLTINGCRLKGRLTNLYTSGRITWRSSSLKAATLIELWIYHLLLNLTAHSTLPAVTIHAEKNHAITLAPVKDPAPQMAQLVAGYLQGLCEPLPFYPQTSLAWAQAKPGNEQRDALRQWQGNMYLPGEQEDPAYQIALATSDPFPPRFIELAQLFLPLLEQMEDFNAPA